MATGGESGEVDVLDSFRQFFALERSEHEAHYRAIECHHMDTSALLAATSGVVAVPRRL